METDRTAPAFNLSVGSNLHVNDVGTDVLHHCLNHQKRQGVAAPAGRCVLTRISEGRLPPGFANWPADVEVESTDFIEL